MEKIDLNLKEKDEVDFDDVQIEDDVITENKQISITPDLKLEKIDSITTLEDQCITEESNSGNYIPPNQFDNDDNFNKITPNFELNNEDNFNTFVPSLELNNDNDFNSFDSFHQKHDDDGFGDFLQSNQDFEFQDHQNQFESNVIENKLNLLESEQLNLDSFLMNLNPLYINNDQPLQRIDELDLDIPTNINIIEQSGNQCFDLYLSLTSSTELGDIALNNKNRVQWKRSVMRRHCLVALGVPFDLDEAIPKRKSNRLNNGQVMYDPDQIQFIAKRLDTTLAQSLCSITEEVMGNYGFSDLAQLSKQLDTTLDEVALTIEHWRTLSLTVQDQSETYHQIIANLVQHSIKLQ